MLWTALTAHAGKQIDAQRDAFGCTGAGASRLRSAGPSKCRAGEPAMTTAMIVMEPGSEWPGHVGDSTNLVFLGHETHDLLGRTQEKLDVLHRSKQAVPVAVLACNAATGAEAAGRRAQLARTLLGPVTSTTCRRLVLTASACAPLQLLQELLTLAEALAEDLRGTTATVSVRFAQRPQKRAYVPGRVPVEPSDTERKKK